MRWLRSRLERRTRHESGVDRELAFHMDALTRDYEAAGMAPDAARRQAQIDFGGREQIKQQIREVYLSALYEHAVQNARAALRLLRKSPALSIAVILTLALGMGANTAVFSAIDAVILRPLPFPQGHRLMAIRQYDRRGKEPWTFTAPSRLEDWNRQNQSFQAISGYYLEDESETSGPLPERLEQALVAPRFLRVWGIAPQLGRDFTPAEEHYGGPSAVLISDRLWRRRFHADPGALGKQVHAGRWSLTIVGVMPAWFTYPSRDVDLWTPSPPDGPYANDRSSTWFNVVGRLRPGVSVAAARADLTTVQGQLAVEFPKTDGRLDIRIEPLKNVIVGAAAHSLWLLYGAVMLLLLIACMNIAALLLARTMDREREIALRFALGASRAAIVAQLLSEVLLLALLGSAIGLALADGAIALLHLVAKTLPRAEEITLNWRLMLYTLGAAMVTTLLCGLYPALRSTRRELSGTLALGGHQQMSSRGTLQWWLVGTQVAFAVTLLVGAGLLLRSFAALGQVSAGFDATHVLVFRISAGWNETVDRNRLTARIDRTLDGLRAVPGVQAAATTATLPGVPGQPQTEFFLVGGERDEQHKLLAVTRFVSADYFATMGIPLLLGEDCRSGPGNQAVLVNQSFADRFLTRGNAIGSRLEGVSSSSFLQSAMIRGLVADAREDGLNSAPGPTVYWCTSAPDPSPYFLVRSAGKPMAMAETLRRRLHAMELERSVFDISPLSEHLDDTLAENRMRTAVLSFFAATAIALACLGLYGTLSYLGRLRQREMGLRLAMGASRTQVAGTLIGRGIGVVSIGCTAGLLIGGGASRLLSGMLYGITRTDPPTYAAILLLVLMVASVACAGPALRAARIDPARALRDE